MPHFEITLKNEKLLSYKRISWIIITVSSLLFLYLSLFANGRHTRISSIGTLILLGFSLLLKFYFRKTKYQIGPAPFFFFILLGWINIDLYWLAAITLLFDLLHIISTRKLVTAFTTDKITYPSFPKKTIDWKELNGVVLKDGLLTIDFKNNKLIQQFIDENSFSINETEFNDFCNEQLSRS